MPNQSIQRARRRFLKRLATVTGAGALLALGTRGKAHAPAEVDRDADKDPESQGYRLTEHIRRYYHNAGL